jgi:predicted metal-dependent phosphoesterase TrpH
MDSALAMITDVGYRIASAPIERVVDAAHASGAVALLAHPGRGGGEIQDYPPDLLDALLDEVALDGIEAYYPLHTAVQVESFERVAIRRGLLVSCGSDSHGPRQRLPCAYQASIVRGLLERLGIPLD